MANRDILDAAVQARDIINARPVPTVGRNMYPEPSDWTCTDCGAVARGIPGCIKCPSCGSTGVFMARCTTRLMCSMERCGGECEEQADGHL